MTKQNEARIAAETIAQQIITTATPKAPSTRALMYRISSLCAAAARRVTRDPDANRAEVFAAYLRAIDEAAALYWKHHART